MNKEFKVGGKAIKPNSVARIEIPIARLPIGTWTSLPVVVIRGKKDGKRLWLTGAIHGEELNGVEIIRRVIDLLKPARMRGAVIAVPIVNVYGFIHHSRYLPDRRDLNRSFPGSRTGSLAAHIAYTLMTQVITHCGYGIDLHTASQHRYNLPQIRADMTDKETRMLAKAFRPPIIMHAGMRDKSLREAATNLGIKTLLYEAGEPNRFNEEAIQAGIADILMVLAYLQIFKGKIPKTQQKRFFYADKSRWIRARVSGLLHTNFPLGMMVKKAQVLGDISDTLGNRRVPLKAPVSGMIVGYTQHPIVNRGDAVIHIAEGRFRKN